MRALRYFLAGFEALLAVFASSAFVVALVVIVQISVRRTPLDAVRRSVVVAELGRAMVESALAAVFALWMGRCAVRNYRDARTQSERRPAA